MFFKGYSFFSPHKKNLKDTSKKVKSEKKVKVYSVDINRHCGHK